MQGELKKWNWAKASMPCLILFFFCTILIKFLSYGKKMFIAFCIPEGLKSRWAFYVSCDTFLPAIHQTKSRPSPDTRALHPLPCLKICMRWNSLAIYNSTWWQEELNWRIMRVFSIIAVKFFSCSCFLVLNKPSSHTHPAVWPSAHCLAKSPQDGARYLCPPPHLHACLWLLVFSHSHWHTQHVFSVFNLLIQHPHGSSSHAWTLKISMS